MHIANTLSLWADADHSKDPATWKSITSIFVTILGVIVHWQIEKQSCIASHSADAEICSFFSAVMLNRYLQEIAQWIGIRMTEPTTIYEDNQACLDVINAGQITQRTRHMAVAVGICQEDVKRGLASGSKVQGTLNMSDNGTKPNPTSAHHFQCRFSQGERFYPLASSLHGKLVQVAMVNYCYSNET